MTPSPHSDHDRLLELLAERALVGLDADQQRQLESLLQTHPDFDAECLDRTAALLDLAAAAGDTEPLPQSLQDRIRADSRLGLQTRPSTGKARVLQNRSSAGDGSGDDPEGLTTEDGSGDPSYEGARAHTLGLDRPSHGQRMHRREVVAWLAAAACLLVAVFTWYTRPTAAPSPMSPTIANIEPPVTAPETDTPDPSSATPTVAQLREQLLASAPRCAAFATGQQRQRCGCPGAWRRYCLEQRIADGIPASAGTGQKRTAATSVSALDYRGRRIRQRGDQWRRVFCGSEHR
jgi:hypothetical protein